MNTAVLLPQKAVKGEIIMNITKKLGFGCMRLPLINEEFTSIHKELFCQMIDYFLDKGFRYFDTAWFYHNGKSEEALRECLIERHPRSSFLLADKMPLVLVREKDELETYFSAQLERCGVDYFDYYLIHDMGENRLEIAEKTEIFSFLSAKKAEGKIRKIGFSFHDTADVLEDLLTEHPEVDFVQLQINYLDWDSDAIQSRQLYETAVKHGKPVIVMEPIKGGTLAMLPNEAQKLLDARLPGHSAASWALRFAASLDNVQMVLSGMNTMEQLTENISCMEDFTPMSEEDLSCLKKVTDIINADTAIACTGCSYCIHDCPKDIAIPKYFSLYNTDLQELKTKSWTAQGMLYGHFAERFGKAGDCIQCGQCEKMCPQHLPIRKLLKTVAEHFE